MAYKKKIIAVSRFLQCKQPGKKVVNSQLNLAAETWPKSHLRGKIEGNRSLFSRVEAQDHLYVSTVLVFLFSNLYPATKKKNRLVEKCVKTVTLPSNGAKNFV